MSGFRLRWSELTKEGWHSRLPTGFPNNYTYLKPGKTKKDVRGVDYFVGEEELMKYLDRVDLEAAKDSLSDVSSAAVIKDVPNPPNDVHHNDEVSNEESVSPTLRYESPHVTHRESQSPVDSSDGSRNEVPRNEDVEFRRLARTAADKSDVNVYQDMGNPDDFTAMVSDAENVNGASGDEECVEKEDNPLDEATATKRTHLKMQSSTRISVKLLVVLLALPETDPVSFTPYPYLDQPYEARSSDSISTEFPNLYKGDYRPSARVLEAASTVMGSFFYFVQPQLWNSITEASNDYFMEKIDERVEDEYQKQLVREREQPRYQKSPNKERLEHHWRTTDEGAIPRGRFGLYMTRDRFMHISRNLHFSNNADHRAVSDRASKLRPVIDALQERFKSGYWPPPVMAFDEAMLPLRVYKKDKPHKWGTKLFMLCCSSSAYCIRFEVYCGKTQTCVNTAGTDAKSGPAAVVRNLKEKYYKSLFLGFIDLAIMNTYIVFNQRRVAEGEKKISHIKFLKQLHLELVQMQEADWEIVCSTQQTPTKSRMGGPVPHRVHELVQ
ncbi:hypothetical protein F443_04507, partial [Phytophthora nicotianae P1569]